MYPSDLTETTTGTPALVPGAAPVAAPRHSTYYTQLLEEALQLLKADDLAAESRRQDARLDELSTQIQGMNSQMYLVDMRAWIDEVVNGIGRALDVPPRPRKKNSVTRATSDAWDREAVLQAWKSHLCKPKTVSDPDIAAYLADEAAVRMVLGVGQGLRPTNSKDAAANTFNEPHFRKYCALTPLPPDFRTGIQKSYTFLYPTAPPLVFRVI